MPAPTHLYRSPRPTLAVTAQVFVTRPGVVVPQSFLGFSYEWGAVHSMMDDEYFQLLEQLSSYGTGPVHIRVGGGSTDKLTDVPPESTWDALRALNRRLNSSMLLGLTFESGDHGLAQRQMQIAQQRLGSAIEAFEVGNEPNFYLNKNGMSGNDYVRSSFVEDWVRFAGAMSCPYGNPTDPGCEVGQLSGPVWGHINMFPTTMNWFLSKTWKFVKLATLHWYKATSETYNTATTLLEEAPIRAEMDNLRAIVQVASKFGIPVRVAEMNTISNSGRRGVSNVFASALWSLDAALEVAATGAVGVNFHQGGAGTLYNAIQHWDGTRPRVQPSFYGMMMLQQALGRGTRMLGAEVKGPSNVKVFPLEALLSGQVRVVIINKNDTRAAAVTLSVGGRGNFYGDAIVTRLVAAGAAPLETVCPWVTLAGQAYGTQGVEVTGERTYDYVRAQQGSAGTTYRVYMPPGSAAIVGVEPLRASAERRPSAATARRPSTSRRRPPIAGRR